MLRFVGLLCLVGVTLGVPAGNEEEIGAYRRWLLDTRNEDATVFEENMKRFPWASAWENSGKYQGDIILTDEEVDELVHLFANSETLPAAGDRGTAVVNRGRLWPNNNVIFEFAGHSPDVQNFIMSVMAMYEQHSCVRFIRRTNQHDHVRITANPTGCYAHVGYYQNMGAHIHNLSPNGCIHGGIIFHEFGHNVGFQHMHQSRVRYDWVHINWNNIQQGTESNFWVMSEAYGDMLGLPYEYASNQHYSAHAFSHNGQPTIHALHPGGEQMGQLDVITGWDLLRIRRLYNCPGGWDAEVRMEDANKPAFAWPSYDEMVAIGAKYREEMERRIQNEPAEQA